MNLGALAGGVLLALFIYWGWDTAVSVNEETERKSIVPGIAAILSTLALVFIYVLATTAAQAFPDPPTWATTRPTCRAHWATPCLAPGSTSCSSPSC